MATRVKRRVDGRGVRITSDNRWEVVREYLVLGPTSELSVYNSVDDDTGFKLPAKGETHPENNTLLVDDLDIQEDALSMSDGPLWVVRVTWRSPTFDQSMPIVEWQWGDGSVSFDADADRNGNPFVSSTGMPVTGTFQDEESTLSLTVWVPQPFFDPSLAFLVRNAVNVSGMTLFQNWAIEEQQMRCAGMRPTSKQNAGTLSVITECVFEFRNGYRPFQPKTIDKAFKGYYDAGGKQLGDFHANKQSAPMADAVLLNGYGIPVNSSIAVTEAWKPAVAPPAVPDWFSIDPASGGSGRPALLVFNRKRLVDFRNFIPGVM